MDTRLTQEDLSTLLEALDAWEREPALQGSLDGLTTGLLHIMAAPKGEDKDASKVIAEAEAARDRVMRRGSGRKNLAIKLKAKLVELGDELNIADAVKGAGNDK